jgi:hypothetical protein
LSSWEQIEYAVCYRHSSLPGTLKGKVQKLLTPHQHFMAITVLPESKNKGTSITNDALTSLKDDTDILDHKSGTRRNLIGRFIFCIMN